MTLATGVGRLCLLFDASTTEKNAKPHTTHLRIHLRRELQSLVSLARSVSRGDVCPAEKTRSPAHLEALHAAPQSLPPGNVITSLT